MPSAAISCRRCRCRGACGRAAASPSTASRCRVGETIRRASKIKSVEPKSGSTGSMVFVTVEHTVSGARGTVVRRGARHRLSRGGQARREAARAQAGARRRHLVEKDHGRPRAAVPLLRAHLQRPSHPLRPALCHRHRRLSRPDRARPVAGHAADRTGAPFQSRSKSPAASSSAPCRRSMRGAAFSVQARREADGSVTTWIADAKGGLAQQGKATFR